MRTSVKKLMSILLAIVMVMAMLPATVLAAEEGNPNEFEFSSFTELKELIGHEYEDRKELFYNGGNGEFVISEDVTLPENVGLHFGDEVIVAVSENAELVIPRDTDFNCGTMNVAGSLIINGNLSARQQLSVTGTAVNNGRIDTFGDNSVSGKIEMGEGSSLYKKYHVEDIEDATAVFEKAAVCKENYIHYEAIAVENAKIVVSEDTTIPDNCSFNCEQNSSVIIEDGVTVVQNGFVILGGIWQVDGRLVCNGEIHLWNNDGGMIEFGKNAVFEGDGVLTAFCQPDENGEVNFNAAVSGLNFDDYFTRERDEGELKCLEISASEFGEDGGYTPNIEFTTLEELNTIIAEHDGGYSIVRYAGESDIFEITEDLKLPDNLELHAGSAKVSEGAVLTIGNGGAHFEKLVIDGEMNTYSFVAVNNLTVNGVFNVCHQIHVTDSLDVYGELNIMTQAISVGYTAEITGLENISYTENSRCIQMEAQFATGKELADVLAEINENPVEDEKIAYNIFFNGGESTEKSVMLETDIAVPANTEVHLADADNLTVIEDAVLTVYGNLNIDNSITVEGSLVNNGMISLHYMDGVGNRKFSMAADSYSGDGMINVNMSAGGKLEDCFDENFPLDDFDATYHIDPEGNYHWELKYAAGLIKLGTPTELSWGKRIDEMWEYDEATDTDVLDYKITNIPGWISWKTALPDQAQVLIKFYRDGENEACYEGHCGFGPDYEPLYRSIDIFMMNNPESGTYYFTVTSLGDYKTYRNSDVAVSGTYTYVKPEAQLETSYDLKWNGREISWTGPQDTTYIDGYEIQYSFSKTGEDGTYEEFGGTSGRSGSGAATNDAIPYDFIQERGIGYYKFRVRALAYDITVIQNAQWSEWSEEAYNVKEISDDVTDELDNIIDAVVNNGSAVDPDDIRNAVQQMDTESLKVSMTADQDKTGTTERIKELENMAAGGPAAISVTQDAAAFDADKISVVGANLNTNTSEADEITLVVDKPQKDNVIPELYDSAVAVSFSMTLTNVNDVKNLEVPVKITLPVPNSINPDFLVILHYDVEGEYEIIHPYVYEENGQIYADFVLSSFSDFVMTQEAAEEEHEHAFVCEVPEERYLVSEADCENAAVYFNSCECGEASEKETFEYGEPLGHTEGKWVVTLIGHKCFCEDCGKFMKSYPGYHRGGKATCCERAVCELCGESYGSYGKHTPSEWQCDEESHWKECTEDGCGEIIKNSKGDHLDRNHDGKCDTCRYELKSHGGNRPDVGNKPGCAVQVIISIIKNWFKR